MAHGPCRRSTGSDACQHYRQERRCRAPCSSCRAVCSPAHRQAARSLARRASEQHRRELIDKELPSLEKLYKHLHANPELSFEEEQTAARLAKELQGARLRGDRPRSAATASSASSRTATGPTVMVRTDMDALPVTEKTGLPYASKVRTRDKDGNEVGVMHACGHDMHMTCWVGTARVLVG